MRMHQIPSSAGLVLVLALFAPGPEALAAYRWVDESGGIHFVENTHQMPESVRTAGRYERVGKPAASKATIEPETREASGSASSVMGFLNPREEDRPHRKYGLFEAAAKWSAFKILRRERDPADFAGEDHLFFHKLRTEIAEIDLLVPGFYREIDGFKEKKNTIIADYNAAVRRMKMTVDDISKNAKIWNAGQDIKVGIAALDAKIRDHRESIAGLLARKGELEGVIGEFTGMYLVPARPFAILATGALAVGLLGFFWSRSRGYFDERRFPLARLLLGLSCLWLLFVMQGNVLDGAVSTVLAGPGGGVAEPLLAAAALFIGGAATVKMGAGARLAVPSLLAAILVSALWVLGGGGDGADARPPATAAIPGMLWGATWTLLMGLLLAARHDLRKTLLLGVFVYVAADAVGLTATQIVHHGLFAGLDRALSIIVWVFAVPQLVNGAAMTAVARWIWAGTFGPIPALESGLEADGATPEWG
jgi:hypothetical protein